MFPKPARIRHFLLKLPLSPEEPRCEPTEIDSRDKSLHHGLDEVFCFNLEAHKATAMNKITVPWSWCRIPDVQTLIQCINADEPTARFLTGMVSVWSWFSPLVSRNCAEPRKPRLNWVHYLSKNESEVDKSRNGISSLHHNFISFRPRLRGYAF